MIKCCKKKLSPKQFNMKFQSNSVKKVSSSLNFPPITHFPIKLARNQIFKAVITSLTTYIYPLMSYKITNRLYGHGKKSFRKNHQSLKPF